MPYRNNRNRLMSMPDAQPDFNRVMRAIRARYKSPREVMERLLGLDQALIDSLLRPSTRDGIVYDARRGRGRDAAIVEEPSSVDPDADERQAGVDRRRRFGRDLEIEQTPEVEKQARGFENMRVSNAEPHENSAKFATDLDDDDEDDEEAAQRRGEVRRRDEEAWGDGYPARRKFVSDTLRKYVNADESERAISRWGVGKPPKNAMGGNLGGRLAKQPTRSSNGIDKAGEGLEDIREAASRIESAGGPRTRSVVDGSPSLMRKGIHEHGEAVALDNLAVVYDRLADGSDRSDRLLSFGSNRQFAPAKMATDKAISDFESCFPGAARLKSDGSGWNR
jgi:hypothetical protein